MDNFLENGAVLPFGLIGVDSQAAMGGFNKSYKNTPLRMGIVIRAYGASDDNNLTKLTTEYDVLVFEQNENRGSSIVTYKNCIVAEGFGSIPDFFEKTLRIRQGLPTESGGLINTKGQNGAVVLIHCLDGMSDKAIIVGNVTHPDRQTTLVNTQPYLQGEYNGVNVEIANDGSVTLTFRGATDNDGNQVDSSQGNTVVKIETDGSFQLNHSTITFRLDKNGTATLTTNGDVNVNAQGNATVQCVDLDVTASGKADLNISGDTNLTVGGDCDATVSGKLVAKASEIDLNGQTGMVLTNITDPVVDTIFGTPTVGVPTVKAG